MFEKTDEAIAMAVMYTANHPESEGHRRADRVGFHAAVDVRIRADIPIYAFTRHEATRHRVMLYRGVYPVTFDITHTDAQVLYLDIFKVMLELRMVEVGDRIILTKGENDAIAYLGHAQFEHDLEVSRYSACLMSRRLG